MKGRDIHTHEDNDSQSNPIEVPGNLQGPRSEE